jgi:hypothetical protein
MPSVMWLCVALVRKDVSDERITSVIRMERISELGTPSASYYFLRHVVSISSQCATVSGY